MGYTTSSVSRRVVMMKVKGKPGARKKKAEEPKPVEKPVARAGRDDFDTLEVVRSSSRRLPQSTPGSGWKTWMTVSLLVVLGAASFAGMYALAKSPRWAESLDAARARTVVKTPSEFNPHAMRYISAPHATLASSTGGMPATGRSQLAASSPRGARSDAGTRVDENDPALLDGRPLVLPADVSGDCEIGERGARDFGACLARSGARAPASP
jgi:hypothetical protein